MILFFLIGVAIMALGIYALQNERKKEKTMRRRAVVQSCTRGYMDSVYQGENYYDITLEVYAQYGTVYKTIARKAEMYPGEACDVYYDEQNDTIELVDKLKNSNKSGGWAFIIFGVLWCLIIGAAMWAEYSKESSEGIGIVFGYVISVAFILIGANMVILKPLKLKRDMVNCQVVPGSLIDYTVKRGKKGRKLYCPIYGYYYNGEDRTVSASISSNLRKYTQIGRQVSIIINAKTGEVYCKEDANDERGMGVIFGILGLAAFVLMVVNSINGTFS